METSTLLAWFFAFISLILFFWRGALSSECQALNDTISMLLGKLDEAKLDLIDHRRDAIQLIRDLHHQNVYLERCHAKALGELSSVAVSNAAFQSALAQARLKIEELEKVNG